jgi:DNA adenine methylase
MATLLKVDVPLCYPVVKWAGGKRQLIKYLDPMMPPQFNRYFEPFLGGGAMFFHMVSDRTLTAYLSDINTELITTYNVIKNNVNELIELLNIHQSEYLRLRYFDKVKQRVFSKHFNEVKSKTNLLNDIEIAARLIFLNKTCFNGLQRVNSKGKFNIPEGTYKNSVICDADNLRNVSIVLSNTSINVSDYKTALAKAEEGDFIYLDPPYMPISDTANFDKYSANGFTKKDHIQLSKTFTDLHNKRCKVLLSNSDTPLVRQLYSNFHIQVVNASRAINSKASRRGKDKNTELIISNY